MTATAPKVLTEQDISLTVPAQDKIAELFGQVDESVQGVRVYVAPGGCSGVDFGMTFTDQLNEDDSVPRDALAACIADLRDPAKVTQNLTTMLSQRVCGCCAHCQPPPGFGTQSELERITMPRPQ